MCRVATLLLFYAVLHQYHGRMLQRARVYILILKYFTYILFVHSFNVMSYLNTKCNTYRTDRCLNVITIL